MARRRKKSGRKSQPRGRGPVAGNLASMSVEALLEMRDEIGEILSSKAGQLQSQLAALGLGDAPKGRRGGSLQGRKVAPKYRNPKNRSETWAGRGATPRWMVAAIKGGKTRESFLIDKSAAKTAAKAKRATVAKAKRGRPAKKLQKAAAPAGNRVAAAASENA
jgi:DNA-binding protein H-NS